MEYLHVDDHIHLDQIRMRFAETIYEAIDQNRAFLRRWLPFVDQTRAIQDTHLFIKSLMTPPESEKNEVYTIWFKGEFTGLIGFKDIDHVNHKAEIGYWLIEKMEGKGIMSRCVAKLSDYGFRNYSFNRIQIKVAEGNRRSYAIPERLGFTFEGIEREGERHSDRYFNLKTYSLLKHEWLDKIING